MLKSAAKDLRKSWVAIGMDMSMTSIAAAAIGWDGALGAMTDVRWGEIRWTPEHDYFTRLGQAANVHSLILDVIPSLWAVAPERVCICIEEPFPMGMMTRKTFTGSWIKQQCEVAGAAKGAIVRYGWPNIYEINNAQWKATLRREGVTIRKMPEGKWDVKEWACQALGLPDLPDLVRGKEGGKIPRPESGRGANAKAVQPSDVYDAAACLAWMMDEIQEGRVW